MSNTHLCTTATGRSDWENRRSQSKSAMKIKSSVAGVQCQNTAVCININISSLWVFGCQSKSWNKASLLIDVAAHTSVNQLFQHRPHLQWYEYRQWWSFGPPGNISESHRQHCLSRDLLLIPLSYLIPLPVLFEPRQQHHNINNTSGENQSRRSGRSICSSLRNNTTQQSLKTAQSSQHRGPNWATGYFYTYWQAQGERPEASCPSEC